MTKFSRRAVVQSLLPTAALPAGAIAMAGPEAPATGAATAAGLDSATLEWWLRFSALSSPEQLRYAALLRAAPSPGLNEMADAIERYVARREAPAKQA
ncbi:hypothetical protein [Devosia sp. CN2-171]|uniref:hypothetical protein n=1 Tax=Devosia sp. CN2-171 TaxID=3400909 RepID=UPI003BF7AA4B